MFSAFANEWVFVLYFLAAAALVFFSIKCANYVDLLDKKTNMSGAFIGGCILAAVTSLPEFVTSLSAIYAVNNPSLIIGNVLGSNVFNACIFAGLTILTVKAFAKSKIGTSHRATILCALAAYALTAVTMYCGQNGQNFARISDIEVNFASLLILVVYGVSLRFLSGDDSENEEEDTSPLTVKQVVLRFIAMSLGLVVMSVIVTMLTDELQTRLHLDASLAGAIFLGVATSLPELSSSIALVRLKNYNAMVGNVVGSNMFNFTIFSVADILAGSTVVYTSAGQTGSMLLFGVVESLLMLGALLLHGRARKNPVQKNAHLTIYVAISLLILVCYILSLVVPIGA